MNDKQNDKPPFLEVGAVKFFTPGSLLLAVLFVLGVLMALKNLVVVIMEKLFGLAVSGGQALLMVFKWGGIAMLIVLVVLLGIGAAELALRAWRERQRQDEVVQSSPLPRNETIRGGPPCSTLDHATAQAVRHYIKTELGLDPANFSDMELAALRLHLPEILARPEYAAQINAMVVAPTYELLLEGSPALERQLKLYGEVQQREPLWLVRRWLHIATRGAMGLSKDQVWQKPQIERLKADLSEYKKWFWRHGFPLLGQLERVLQAETQPKELGEVSEDSPAASEEDDPSAEEEADPDPDSMDGSELESSTSEETHAEEEGAATCRCKSASPSASPSGDPEAARYLLERAREAREAPEPWLDPTQRLTALEDAAHEAHAHDPESTDAQALLEQVQSMWERLPEFDQQFTQAMRGDASNWPAWINEAFVASRGDPSPNTVKGHAARLFLTQTWDSAFADISSAPPSTVSADTADPNATAGEAQEPDESAEETPSISSPHLTLIQTTEPSDTELAERLF